MTVNPLTISEQVSIAWNVSKVWDHAARKLLKSAGGSGTTELSNSMLDAHTVFEQLNHELQGRLMASLGTAGVDVRGASLSYHHMLLWKQFGFPVFRPTHGLCSALILTDCSGIFGRDLVFPFGSYAIDLPYPKPLISFTHPDGRQVDARSILVHFYQSLKGKEAADAANTFRSKMGIAGDLARSGNSNEAKRLVFEAHESARGISFEPWINVRLVAAEGCDVTFNWPMPPDEERIASMLDHSDDDRAIVGLGTFEKQDGYALKAAMRLVVNLCLYVNSQHSTKPWSGHSASSTKRRVDGSPEPTTWVVGREIKLPSAMIDAARAFGENGGNRSAWRVHSRFTVRGHWRNQVCGQGRQDRKTIWIQPHWKGPPDGTALTRLYGADLPTANSPESAQ